MSLTRSDHSDTLRGWNWATRMRREEKERVDVLTSNRCFKSMSRVIEVQHRTLKPFCRGLISSVMNPESSTLNPAVVGFDPVQHACFECGVRSGCREAPEESILICDEGMGESEGVLQTFEIC